MFKKIFKFISGANQILFFIAVILMLFVFIGDEFRVYRDEPNKVEIIKESDQKSGLMKAIYTKKFEERINDVLIFMVHSEVIYPNAEHRTGSTASSEDALYFAPGYRRGSSDRTVNVMFVYEQGPSYLLFENDRLILSTEFAHSNVDESWPPTLEKNLYAVVDADSNGDGFLGEDDETHLYSSDYNGKNVKLILKNVSAFQLIDDNKILITQVTEHLKQFYVCNLTSGEIQLLDSNM